MARVFVSYILIGTCFAGLNVFLTLESHRQTQIPIRWDSIFFGIIYSIFLWIPFFVAFAVSWKFRRWTRYIMAKSRGENGCSIEDFGDE